MLYLPTCIATVRTYGKRVPNIEEDQASYNTGKNCIPMGSRHLFEELLTGHCKTVSAIL